MHGQKEKKILQCNKATTKLRAQYEEEVSPSRRWLHKFIIMVSAGTAISVFNMGLGQFIGIVFQQVGPIKYVLRVYAILLCILVVFNELEGQSL
jgi:hypothetical protein